MSEQKINKYSFIWFSHGWKASLAQPRHCGATFSQGSSEDVPFLVRTGTRCDTSEKISFSKFLSRIAALCVRDARKKTVRGKSWQPLVRWIPMARVGSSDSDGARPRARHPRHPDSRARRSLGTARLEAPGCRGCRARGRGRATRAPSESDERTRAIGIRRTNGCHDFPRTVFSPASRTHAPILKKV